jgi:hypothetical protein
MKTVNAHACGRVVAGSARVASAIRLTMMSGVLAMLVGGSVSLSAQTPAFPSAVGFGSLATAARGGTVYHVTNLNDSGAGSFRDAVSAGNRTVVFDVGGYVVLSSAVTVSSNVNIEGQTAPGQGIGLMGAEISFYGHNNIICRYVRFRQGSLGSSSQSGINIGSSGGSGSPTSVNIIFDHCSVEFGSYDSIDGVGCDNITVQNSIIADPIGQQFGAHIEGGNVTWYNNIWSSGHNRQPLAKNNTQYIQNLVYNYAAAYTVANTGGSFSHDIVNNYFITGPATTSSGNDFYQMDSNQSVYRAGNLLDSNNDGTLNGGNTAPGGVIVLGSPWAATTTALTTRTAAQAYAWDLTDSGALPHDEVDNLVISQIQKLGHGTTGTGAGTDGPGGGLYTSQSQTGLGNSGYGNLTGGTAPTDTDQDGIPDTWETNAGLSSTSGTDGSAVSALFAPYTNLEVYTGSLVGDFPSIYQAELGTFSANSTVDNNHAGYTGTGFVNTTNAVGSYVEWTVNAPKTATYTISFRYASIDSRPVNFSVNGTVTQSNVAFPASGDYTIWNTVTLTQTLNAGTNKLRITATSSLGIANMDCLLLQLPAQ